MIELEPTQIFQDNTEPDQLDDALETELPEEVTIEAVRKVLLEIDLGITYEELFEAYAEVYGLTEEKDFILDLFEAGDGQKEEGDSVETIIEIGVNYLALSLGLV